MMIGKRTQALLTTMLCGLCMAMLINTTVVAAAGRDNTMTVTAQASASGAPLQTSQNDIALPPPPATLTQPEPATPPSAGRRGSVRIALLLPLRSGTLGAAADAVRAGFEAAYTRERSGIAVTIFSTEGGPQDALAGYADAAARNDIVVGPLSRSEVAAIALSGTVTVPTVALAQPDAGSDADVVLPPRMLAIGLSIEEEARQAANWIATDKMIGKAVIVSTNVAWQRRAAKAFAMQWRALGLSSQAVELGVDDGYLSANSIMQLQKRWQTERPDVVFAALDAGLTAQLRLGIGGDIPIYGTSQLNPLALSDWESSEKMPDMEGVRLLDMPWQLQADHPAVMIYPRPAPDPDQRRGADLERLYALGIDAYRIAREIAAGKSSFELDGVTGKLRINLGGRASRFERIEQPAVYQDGKVAPLDTAY